MKYDIFLRSAVEVDVDRLFDWKNDPETRRNSINSKEVSRDEHAAWFDNMLRTSGHLLLIADDNDVSVGVVRIDWDDKHEACDLSFTVAPEHRGKGYGLAIAESAIKDMGEVRVSAEVKITNIASRRILETLGFRIIDSQGELLMYAKDCLPRVAA